MNGHLELACRLGATGRSQLGHQSFSAPMHISKPHLEGDTLVVNVVNPTAGVFEGDVVRCSVAVETGARLLLTSPSATRAHLMAKGGEAKLTQYFTVATEGWLEVWPEIFIPQAGACYRQKTTIIVESGGGLLFFETLAPGRVAAGETFGFKYLDWETDIFYAGELVAREKYNLSPEGMGALRRWFPTGYYACIFLFHLAVTPASSCWEAMDALHGGTIWIGYSRLHDHGWSIKILAADSVAFRKTLNLVRQYCHEAMGGTAPDLRRQ